MPTGSCYRGSVKVSYTGEPVQTALCQCSSCRHYTSSIFSHNIVVPSSDFTILGGTVKEISKIADSGKTITNAFCPECGTTMYRWGASFVGKDGMRIIQAGILDNEKVLNELKIDLEMFTVNRREWGVY